MSSDVVDEVVSRLYAALNVFIIIIVLIGFSPVVFGLAIVFRSTGLVIRYFEILALCYFGSFQVLLHGDLESVLYCMVSWAGRTFCREV